MENKIKVLTIKEYAKHLGINLKEPFTLEDVQQYSEDILDKSLWDYPLKEIGYVLENVSENVVLVYDSKNVEVRICEF